MATALLKNAAKIGVGVAAIYVTVDQGIWSNSSMGRRALTKVQESVLPKTTEYINSVPSLEKVNTSILDSWNSGVKTVFGFVSDSPTLVASYSGQAIDNTASFIRDVNK